jgi:MSHA pilin protein MshD
MCTSKAARQRGVTLIELILFIVIIGVALGGILGVLSFTARHSPDPVRRKQALMIAQALLEEVELAQFTYCDPTSDNADSADNASQCHVHETFGPEPGESRPYDNVNDYGGSPTRFNDVNGNLVDVNGNAFGVTGYSATLAIQPDTLGAIPGGVPDDPDVLRITVTVNYDNGQSVQLDGYRARYAPKVQ